MKNGLNWETGENGSFPLILEEKGLGLKGIAKFFFYFCSVISFLSMIWVIVISIGAFAAANRDPTVPDSYKFIALASIGLSLFCINTLYRFYKDRINYYKRIEIADGKIKFKEINSQKTTEWEEKIRKYTSVDLHHYNYRRVSSWYIFLQHPNKERKIALFAPDYDNQSASEEDKRKILESYGKLFDLPANYLTLEESYKATNQTKD